MFFLLASGTAIDDWESTHYHGVMRCHDASELKSQVHWRQIYVLSPVYISTCCRMLSVFSRETCLCRRLIIHAPYLDCSLSNSTRADNPIFASVFLLTCSRLPYDSELGHCHGIVCICGCFVLLCCGFRPLRSRGSKVWLGDSDGTCDTSVQHGAPNNCNLILNRSYAIL